MFSVTLRHNTCIPHERTLTTSVASIWLANVLHRASSRHVNRWLFMTRVYDMRRCRQLSSWNSFLTGLLLGFLYLHWFCKTLAVRLDSCISEEWIDNVFILPSIDHRIRLGNSLSPVAWKNKFTRLVIQVVCPDSFLPLARHLFAMSRLFTSTAINSWRAPNCRLICGSSVTQIRCNTSVFGSQTQAWSYVKQQTLDESSSKVCLIFNLL